MRQVHVARKLFVDYSGTKPSIVDPKTGEIIKFELFVAVLGASNCTHNPRTGARELPRRREGIGSLCGAYLRAGRRSLVRGALYVHSDTARLALSSGRDRAG
jgi:hypothetical protein